ncbi:unnamed protein product [Xylocopa violacea]|uniref:Uncharacterized protein n=1 Tax=Xylocopa violacea TaxID=135666 RepID=A0ABP1P4B6_XYLVO
MFASGDHGRCTVDRLDRRRRWPIVGLPLEDLVPTALVPSKSLAPSRPGRHVVILLRVDEFLFGIVARRVGSVLDPATELISRNLSLPFTPIYTLTLSRSLSPAPVHTSLLSIRVEQLARSCIFSVHFFFFLVFFLRVCVCCHIFFCVFSVFFRNVFSHFLIRSMVMKRRCGPERVASQVCSALYPMLLLFGATVHFFSSHPPPAATIVDFFFPFNAYTPSCCGLGSSSGLDSSAGLDSFSSDDFSSSLLLLSFFSADFSSEELSERSFASFAGSACFCASSFFSSACSGFACGCAASAVSRLAGDCSTGLAGACSTDSWPLTEPTATSALFASFSG